MRLQIPPDEDSRLETLVESLHQAGPTVGTLRLECNSTGLCINFNKTREASETSVILYLVVMKEQNLKYHVSARIELIITEGKALALRFVKHPKIYIWLSLKEFGIVGIG